MQVQSLHIYPVKGARGIDVKKGALNYRGFRHDRRWVMTDDAGEFLSQRSTPELARIVTKQTSDGLRLETADGGDGVDLRLAENGARRTIKVWRDEIDARVGDRAAADWLSGLLGRPAELHFMDDAATRNTSGVWGPARPLAFSDAYPVLLITAASLDALNEEIVRQSGDPVPMTRFRPNIVIDGSEPWGDDFWKVIKVGDVIFDLVKPCDRCVVTTTDQATGERVGKEPLKSLANIRRSADPRVNGVLFGSNAVPRNEGDISVGDTVEVIEERPEGWPIAPVK